MDDFDSRPIVVGVDGSPASRDALRWAVDEAARRGCAVDAVLAWDGGYDMMIGVVPADVLVQSARWRDGHAWRQVLGDAVAEVAPRGEVRTNLVTRDPGPALVEASENAALLVVGNRGLGSIKGALLGSVSSYCIRNSVCPVVVINDSSPPEDKAPSVGSGALTTSVIPL